MTSLTIHNLEEAIVQGLRRRAVERGVSMEEEVDAILRAATLDPLLQRDISAAIQARFAPLDGVDLSEVLSMREPGRAIPTLD